MTSLRLAIKASLEQSQPPALLQQTTTRKRLAIKASLEQSQPPALLQQTTTRKRGKAAASPPSKKSKKATAAGPPSWTRGDVQLRPTRATLRGLNVQRPWAPMLLDGSKVIETRTYDIDKQKCFANEWFWVVETPGKKRQRGERAHITGCIKFSRKSVRYTSLAQWRADEDKHRIPAGSEYDWNGRGAMYGWRVERAYALRSPLPRPDPKGVINSKPVTRTVPRGGWLA